MSSSSAGDLLTTYDQVALSTNRSETESIIVPLDDTSTGLFRTGETIYFMFPHTGVVTALRFKANASPATTATIDLKINATWGSTPVSMLSGGALGLGTSDFEVSTTGFSTIAVGAQDMGALTLAGDSPGGTCSGAYAIIEYERRSADVLTDIDP